VNTYPTIGERSLTPKEKQMLIAVFGATGQTGTQIVQQAESRGLRVRALARDPHKLRERLPAAPGGAPRESAVVDVREPEAVIRALAGVDAVISSLGWTGPTDEGVLTAGTRAILDAMAASGTTRLIVTSASGRVVDGDDPLSRWLAKPILRRMLRAPFADMAAMEDLVRASDTDWTILRPPMLVDGEERGYRSRHDGNVRWRYRLRRADLAAAALDCLADPGSIGQTISLAG